MNIVQIKFCPTVSMALRKSFVYFFKTRKFCPCHSYLHLCFSIQDFTSTNAPSQNFPPN